MMQSIKIVFNGTETYSYFQGVQITILQCLFNIEIYLCRFFYANDADNDCTLLKIIENNKISLFSIRTSAVFFQQNGMKCKQICTKP